MIPRYFKATAAAIAFFLTAGAANAQTVSVGSKNFTEQFIVAEIYAQALEKAGLDVQRRLNLGATQIAHSALTSGEIDLYPEYTGTSLAYVVQGDLEGDKDSIYQEVKDYYENELSLTLLDSTDINNGYAIMVRPETAEEYSLATLTDLGPVSGELTFGAEGTFGERSDGLPGLERVYGIKFKEFVQFAQLGIRYNALTSGQIDSAFGFTTDWQIADSELVVLDDDKGLFPPYYLVPVVRQDALEANPQIAEVLNRISPLLNNENMRAMNAQVERDRQEPAEVAAEFLAENGI